MAVWTFIVGQSGFPAREPADHSALSAIIENIPMPQGLFSTPERDQKIANTSWKSGTNTIDSRFTLYKEVEHDRVLVIFQNDIVIIIGPTDLFQMYFYFSLPENAQRRDRWMAYSETILKKLGSRELIVMTEFEEEDFPNYDRITHMINKVPAHELTDSIDQYTSNCIFRKTI